MRHLVVGTAGHIDHGKSALVRALTGIDPDRLKHEKDRGITIELGFADLPLDDDHVVSFVDAPGHERFVRHMVAGATGIDAVVLVVAADQGVQPQTREHLEICELLHVHTGFVLLSKADLVDDELLEVVTIEVRELIAGTFLDRAPIVPASARTGDGLEAVRRELRALFDRVPERPSGGLARLPVDRAFVLRGFGTVVTGTVASGGFAEGEEAEVLPGGRRARIRGLQVHGHKVAEVRAGQRAAVNLQGVSTDEVPRGSTVVRPGTLATTDRIWARLRLLPHAPDGIRKGGPVRFHHGTCERAARLRVLGEEVGGDLRVELFLAGETLLLPGDRFILRRPAPVDTVGGGVIVDARPPAGRGARGQSRHWTPADPDDAVTIRLARAGRTGRGASALASDLGWSRDELDERLGTLERRGGIVRVGGTLFDGEVLASLRGDVLTSLETFHRREPLRRATSREGLRSKLCPEMPREAWRAFLERMVEDGDVVIAGDGLALSSHEVVLSRSERRLKDAIESRFREAGLEPPSVDEVLAGVGATTAPRLVELLVDSGRLVRLPDGRLFHVDGLEAMYATLREHARTCRRIDVQAFKRLFGVTRKNAIPLLEHLDGERRTRRVGNEREILDV